MAMNIHPSVTPERVVEAVEREMFSLDNPGFCIACGEEAEVCEPDAREYECDSCGERQVYGARRRSSTIFTVGWTSPNPRSLMF